MFQINSRRTKLISTIISRLLAKRLLYGCANPYTVRMVTRMRAGNSYVRKSQGENFQYIFCAITLSMLSKDELLLFLASV